MAPILFYNRNNGAGAVGFAPSTKVFAAGAFATGWTHVVAAVQPPAFH